MTTVTQIRLRRQLTLVQFQQLSEQLHQIYPSWRQAMPLDPHSSSASVTALILLVPSSPAAGCPAATNKS